MKELLAMAKIDEPVELIEECFNKAAELEALGFGVLAERTAKESLAREKQDILAYLKEYPKITPAMINKYMAGYEEIAAREMWKIREKEQRYNPWGVGDYTVTKIRYDWVETPIHGYDKYPPQDALDKLAVAKSLDLFDNFTIATVVKQVSHERVKVPDPILLGVIYGSTDRYVIAQWDDDIDLDKLLKGD